MSYDPERDFYRRSKDPALPASVVTAVTPSDDTDFEVYPKALYVGTGGDVAVIPSENADDTPIVFKNVPDGGYVLTRARRVLAAGTTATDILALAG